MSIKTNKVAHRLKKHYLESRFADTVGSCKDIHVFFTYDYCILFYRCHGNHRNQLTSKQSRRVSSSPSTEYITLQ